MIMILTTFHLITVLCHSDPQSLKGGHAGCTHHSDYQAHLNLSYCMLQIGISSVKLTVAQDMVTENIYILNYDD